MFKTGIIVLMIATTLVVSATAQDGYKVGIEYSVRWDEMDQEESNGPKHKLLRGNIDEQEQEQTVDGVPVSAYRRVNAKCMLKYAKYSLNWAECISEGYREVSHY